MERPSENWLNCVRQLFYFFLGVLMYTAVCVYDMNINHGIYPYLNLGFLVVWLFVFGAAQGVCVSLFGSILYVLTTGNTFGSLTWIAGTFVVSVDVAITVFMFKSMVCDDETTPKKEKVIITGLTVFALLLVSAYVFALLVPLSNWAFGVFSFTNSFKAGLVSTLKCFIVMTLALPVAVGSSIAFNKLTTY